MSLVCCFHSISTQQLIKLLGEALSRVEKGLTAKTELWGFAGGFIRGQ
jgi:hypothetical protein